MEKNNRQIFKDFISYPISTFEESVKKNKYLFAYLGNSECPDCSTFFPILEKKISDYELQSKLIYVDGVHLRTNKDNWQKFKNKYGFSQTPAFVIYRQNQIISKIEWDEKRGLSEKDFDHWLEDNMKIINSIEY